MPRPWRPTRRCGTSCGATTAKATGRCWSAWPGKAASRHPLKAFKLRAEIVERCFAHNLDRGGMRRTWLRGRGNVHKRYLLHVAGHNLSLLMRQLIGARHPAGGRGGRIWRYFRSAHAHRGHAGGTGGLAKRPDGFRRRIPHLGVRAGKSHLINGLLTSIQDEPDPTLTNSLNCPKCFDNGQLLPSMRQNHCPPRHRRT